MNAIFFSQYIGKVKIQNNLNFSLGATTVDATTVDATTETWDNGEIITTIIQYAKI